MLRLHPLVHKRPDNIINIQRIRWLADQRHFKKAVIQRHILSRNSAETSDRMRVRNHTVEKFSLYHIFLTGNFQRIRPHGRQTLYPFNQIGRMSEHVFRILGRSVGHVCKYAKRRHINENTVVKFTHVAGKVPAVHYHVRGMKHILWNTQTVCEIICASRRHISHRKSLF